MFDDMERMMDSMVSGFDDVMPDVAPMGMTGMTFAPRVDVTRRDDRIIVHADLPGMSPEDLEVQVTQDGLVLQGERSQKTDRREDDVWQSERSYGRFYRMIPLPEGTDLDSAEARFENGVLEISLKMTAEQAGRRRIEIQSDSSARPGQRAQGTGAQGTGAQGQGTMSQNPAAGAGTSREGEQTPSATPR
jgi:HSP20 family protein